MALIRLVAISVAICACAVSAFLGMPFVSVTPLRSSKIQMAQCQFPGGKKAEGKAGEPLKDVVAKAKYNAPYGCEEGKCGSCEHKVGGKKVRLCIGKVPAGNGPHVFTQ